MIGIIIALEYEINEDILKQATIKHINNFKYYIFNNRYVLLFCGVGKTNAAIGCTNLINNFQIDHIINIGCCGSANLNMNILNIILVDKCFYGDVDVSVDPKYLINQIPYEPKYFYSNIQYLNFLDDFIKQNFNEYNIYKGSLITVDSFVNQNNIYKFNEIDNNEVLGIDMECTSIGQVCNKYNIKFNAIKLISDLVYKKNDFLNYDKNLESISQIIKNIFCYIIKITS